MTPKAPPRAPRRDVRDELRLLAKAGWKHVGYTGGGHVAIEHSEYGKHSLPATPGDHRWRKNQRRDIARKMGLTTADLERLIGVKAPKAKSAKRSKNVRRPKQPAPVPLRTTPAPPPPEPQSDVDRLKQKWGRTIDERRAAAAMVLTIPERPPSEPLDLGHVRNGKAHPCIVCGKTIEPTGRRGRPATTCSSLCRRESNRLRRDYPELPKADAVARALEDFVRAAESVRPKPRSFTLADGDLVTLRCRVVVRTEGEAVTLELLPVELVESE